MANWTSIPTSVLEIGKPVRSIDIIALRDNDTALTEGAAGAPKVQTAGITDLAVTNAKLAANAVTQGKVSTATASGTTNISTSSSGSVALTGGTFSWWTLSATMSGLDIARWGNGDIGAGILGFDNQGGGGNAQIHRDERYIQASPPYNLGNGDIPLFVFATIDGLGNIQSIEVGQDPTWAYHGPTDIRPERYDALGRAYRRYQEINGEMLSSALKDRTTLSRFLSGELQTQLVEREITQAIKNRDMNVCPHPWFAGNDLTGLTVVMLDPLSPLINRLLRLSEAAGARAALEIVKSDVIIGNVPLGFVTPPGVMPVGCRLR